ncbi:CGGC domain-containing protein [Fusibacter paucivorans]|uniref:CGGC domain-containing protein n=1 Tax=Fusibacter paucivorans TaxID=76009 RepID=A0ABS5PKH2_9FIRM|nr:CGGC domain-containing protein [Fusibacter paucivorans]MBS7525387.1 CGGC domain-containing protein [Fusibacter paucivorans]
MKRIAILSCLEATAVCSGAACFKALNSRMASFERYRDEAVEVVAFWHCNGCQCDYQKDAAFLEKIEAVVALKPHAVHIGKCTVTNGQRCSVITDIASYLEVHDIQIIQGTH